MTEARSLRWNDFPLAYRLIGNGVSFDWQFRLTIGEEGLRNSLLIGASANAVVFKQNAGGFGMFAHTAGTAWAGLAYLAPSLETTDSDTTWLHLLDGLTQLAGQQGIMTIRAEVSENAPAFETLRHADYGTYGRQSIWQRPTTGRVTHTSKKVRRDRVAGVIPLVDAWNNQIPKLLRQTQVQNDRLAECYILGREASPRGVAVIHRGARTSLLDIFLSPEASPQDGYLGEELGEVVSHLSSTIICRLHHRLGWFGNCLSDLGFAYQSDEAVMIRHSYAQVKHMEFSAAPKSIKSMTPTASIKEPTG